MKIKKGDKVVITRGKDKGKKTSVEKVFPGEAKVLLTGANLFKKHLKPRGEGKPGGIIDVGRPLSVSSLALICPKCNQPTRIGYLLSKNNKEKTRICRKCKNQI
ncbi:MAG: 50S ribosomal protein L24 [Microgenomates group bacterium ADurb.Bin219]|nr:MAG: 50S ribosomal protein L24 [Microgenomates group bacterium ADurb.Bin219]HNP89211.1 50S ribosomal protein L24 [Candidatus Woesebacteria bacterium]